MTLADLKNGESARIIAVHGEDSLRRHFLAMGVLPETEVTLIKRAPMGDPIELQIRGYALAIRVADAQKIEVIAEAEKTDGKDDEVQREEFLNVDTKKRVSVPQKQHNVCDKLTFALVGNQNCGKTTLFNQLTGANQHVGNFPGVTVDRKDGSIRGYEQATITDLPGIYSMSPYSAEERIARDFLLSNRPSGIINVVDANNLERQLYLTMQLRELGIPMVLALNMMDEIRGNGGTIWIETLAEMLNMPVVPISAAKNEGIEDLVKQAIATASVGESPMSEEIYEQESKKEDAIQRCMDVVMPAIAKQAERKNLPIRFCASKLIEGDEDILKRLHLHSHDYEKVKQSIEELEQAIGGDGESAMAHLRFRRIERICQGTVRKPKESKEYLKSVRMDQLFTGKHTAFLIFGGVMLLIFWLTFGVIGQRLSDILGMSVDGLANLCDRVLTAADIHPILHGLIIDGIFVGVGSVLMFLPTIVTLFFFLSLLEDSGYMARVAFIMDKPLRKIGLSGKSFVPLCIGFGCSVPAIMATRTLPSERDRKMTILLTPFMSCSAKLPIYALFTAAFFPQHGAVVMIGLYSMGILVAIFYAACLRRTKFKGEPIPFVMEMPNYRFPNLKTVAHLLWDKATDFISKAFGIIFIASIVIWFLQTFDARLLLVEDSADSLLALLGNLIAPIFRPLGFDDWKMATALMTGFIAKESVVSTLMVLLGNASLTAVLTPRTAFVFLVFTLLYTPCVAAISAVQRELGKKWAVAVVISQCSIAWLIAFLVNGILLLFG